MQRTVLLLLARDRFIAEGARTHRSGARRPAAAPSHQGDERFRNHEVDMARDRGPQNLLASRGSVPTTFRSCHRLAMSAVSAVSDECRLVAFFGKGSVYALRLGAGNESDEENPMQDLFQNYVSELNKLRDEFHNELTATAQELSKAMGLYARRSEEALASFMEKVSARGVELEAAAAARLDQFRGLPSNSSLPHVDNGPLVHTPTNADRVKIAAERAVADGLLVESEGDRRPQSGRPMTLVKSGPAA